MENNGFGGIWGIIMLLIVAGLFGNNGFGNNYNNARADISNEFLYNQMANDIRANGQAIATTDRDVLLRSCNTDKEVLQNRYDNALQTQTLSSQMASCCCELKTAIHKEGEDTRALITANRINELEYQLNQANTAVANAVQTQNILNSLGNYYPRTGINPYGVYGCNNSYTQI